ncbi:histone-lysine N-methyltransferase SETMAR-like [Trichonephila clavipes]|nr:histone-lysine N-methyltransferase SETMAR-like [Trichonephila clavipes]
MKVNKEKIRFFLQFFFDKSKNESQVAEIANGVYRADTVTDNNVQFWFHRFRSGIFDVKDVPRTGRPIVENVDKISEIIEIDQHVSSRTIAQERGEAAQTAAKPGLRPGIIYCELLPNGQALNSDLYCQQLDRLKLPIDQKRPELANRRGVVFHQDNARPHTSVVTRQ